MPFNAQLGNTIEFTAVFFDTSQNITVPTSATLTIVYPTAANSLTTASCSIGMTAAGSFFTATWSSTVAALGLSSFSAAAPGQVTGAPGTTGTLRLVS